MASFRAKEDSQRVNRCSVVKSFDIVKSPKKKDVGGASAICTEET